MEDMNIKPTIQEVAKHPFAYLLIATIGIIWFFVYQFSGASNQANKNCEKDKTDLKIELTIERKEKDDLYKALLVSNGIIKEIKKNTDSVFRKKVGNEAIKIINK